MININGKGYPWEEGLTVKQLLAKKSFTFPLIVVTVNGEPVAESEYVCTIIEDGDDVKAIHLISGG